MEGLRVFSVEYQDQVWCDSVLVVCVSSVLLWGIDRDYVKAIASQMGITDIIGIYAVDYIGDDYPLTVLMN